MTIEELVNISTDQEGFAHKGEVVVEMPDDGSRYATAAVRYDPAAKLVIVVIA